MKPELIELQEIAKQSKGILQPQAVVEYAKNPETALHSHFTWDDSTAAQAYRIWQARQIISVTVTILETKNGAMNIKAFVSLKPDRQNPGGGYRVLAVVMGDEGQRRQLLSDALAELQVFQQKYQSLTELSAIMDEIARVNKKPRKRRKEVRAGL